MIILGKKQKIPDTLTENKMHYCSDKCEDEREQCDLCRAQYHKLVSDKAIKEGRPTLTYNPFASLLGKK
jgi:hypothetical protein